MTSRETTGATRPAPGKYVVDATKNSIVKVRDYGEDSSGPYIEVERLGSYRARVRLPLSCIRPLTETDRVELSEMVDAGLE